jgi:hypothetical protein
VPVPVGLGAGEVLGAGVGAGEVLGAGVGTGVGAGAGLTVGAGLEPVEPVLPVTAAKIASTSLAFSPPLIKVVRISVILIPILTKLLIILVIWAGT